METSTTPSLIQKIFFIKPEEAIDNISYIIRMILIWLLLVLLFPLVRLASDWSLWLKIMLLLVFVYLILIQTYKRITYIHGSKIIFTIMAALFLYGNITFMLGYVIDPLILGTVWIYFAWAAENKIPLFWSNTSISASLNEKVDTIVLLPDPEPSTRYGIIKYKIIQYLKDVPNLYTKCVLLYVIAYIVIIIIHDAFFRVPDEVIPGVLGVYNAPTLSGLESLGLLIGFLLIMINGIFGIIDIIKWRYKNGFIRFNIGLLSLIIWIIPVLSLIWWSMP